MNNSTTNNSKGGIMNTIAGLFGSKKNNTSNGSTPAVNATAVLAGGKRRKSRRGRKSRKARKGGKGGKTRTHRKH